MEIILSLNKYLFSPLMLGVLFVCGGFLLFYLRGFPFSHPKRVISALCNGNILSSFKAMTLALAGTLGVGNIVGVATAIHLGGAGSVLWMLLSALVAMVIKYAEIYLALLYRRRGKGGTAYYIKYGLKKPLTAAVFSILTLISSFTVGNIIQVNAVAQAFESELCLPRYITGMLLALLAFLVLYKGISRISSFTLAMIPLLTVGFLLLSAVVIASNITLVPKILRQILSSAFSAEGFGGGLLGFFTSGAVRYGIARGIGSNEAGCGTAPTAHSTAENASPARQGCWGIFEVFCDTVVICTVTALVILIYPQHIPKYNGMLLAIKAYESFFGNAAGYILSLAIFMFALSTVICWSYYGSGAIEYFTDKVYVKRLYLVFYCLVTVLGSIMGLEFVWELSDLTVAAMTVTNCISIILLHKALNIPE